MNNFHHLLTIFQFPATICIWQMDVSKGDDSILSIFSCMLWPTPHVLQAGVATSDRWILIDLCVLYTTVVKGKQSGREMQPKGVGKTLHSNNAFYAQVHQRDKRLDRYFLQVGLGARIDSNALWLPWLIMTLASFRISAVNKVRITMINNQFCCLRFFFSFFFFFVLLNFGSSKKQWNRVH